MQNLFYEVDSLDKRAYTKFHLTEEILMENAASGMATYIKAHFPFSASILIVCGSGNNGADGITLARILHKTFPVSLYLHTAPSTDIGKEQLTRARAIGVKEVNAISPHEIIVDCLFGSGLNRNFDDNTTALINQLNTLKATKIACDFPSGLNKDAKIYEAVFDADITLTMGGLKRALFSDEAKEVAGEIHRIDLGISPNVYEEKTPWKLLETTDLKPPYRENKNTHKGVYGHLSIITGEKEGAAIIAGLAALNYGTGLVTLISEKISSLDFTLMQSSVLPENTTAIACGMGLGREFQRERLSHILSTDLPLLLDADIFYHSIFIDLLHKELLITPHPKEFIHILKVSNIANISVQELQRNRFEYVEKFTQRFPHVTLILKGANPIIAHDNTFYVNPHGTSALAKAGSGDVLAGICAALLAQGYTPLEAAIQGSLAQCISAGNSSKSSFALTPKDIINGLAHL